MNRCLASVLISGILWATACSSTAEVPSHDGHRGAGQVSPAGSNEVDAAAVSWKFRRVEFLPAEDGRRIYARRARVPAVQARYGTNQVAALLLNVYDDDELLALASMENLVDVQFSGGGPVSESAFIEFMSNRAIKKLTFSATNWFQVDWLNHMALSEIEELWIIGNTGWTAHDYSALRKVTTLRDLHLIGSGLLKPHVRLAVPGVDVWIGQ